MINLVYNKLLGTIFKNYRQIFHSRFLYTFPVIRAELKFMETYRLRFAMVCDAPQTSSGLMRPIQELCM